MQGSFRNNPERKKILKTQLAIVCAALVLAALSYFAAAGNKLIKDGNKLPRAGPGGADKEYELVVGGLSDSYENISVTVSSREYSEEEALRLFDSLMEGLSAYIVGNNTNLGGIDTDLVLPKKIEGFEGITLTWIPGDRDLISEDGTVHNMGLTESVDTWLDVEMKAGSSAAKYRLAATVLPAGEVTAQMLVEQLEVLISDADQEQSTDEYLELPGEIGGTSIFYEEKKDSSWLQIAAAGLVAAVLIGLRPEQERRQKQKERESELLADYSDILSRLIIYMGAGLTVRNAWLSIAYSYRDALSDGRTVQRAAYDEMLITAGDLEKGIPESRALGDFARRCSQKCYLKMVSLLEQNTRIGDARAEASMQLEIQEAFEQRKNVARRLGEEAGTKLMLPLIISLINVFMIVGVPALLTLS